MVPQSTSTFLHSIARLDPKTWQKRKKLGQQFLSLNPTSDVGTLHSMDTVDSLKTDVAFRTTQSRLRGRRCLLAQRFCGTISFDTSCDGDCALWAHWFSSEQSPGLCASRKCGFRAISTTRIKPTNGGQPDQCTGIRSRSRDGRTGRRARAS